MRESRFTRLFQIPTHYYTTFGLARYDEHVHIKVLKVIPTSRILAWVLGTKPRVEECALRVPYEQIHKLHDLISTQTDAYFDRKKRRGYSHATRQLEQFVRETQCLAVSPSKVS